MAETEPSSKTKRRIVKNPETFRERAIKATELSEKPTRRSRVLRAPGKVVVPVARPIGRGAKKVGNFLPFRLLGKVLRLIGLVLVPRYVRNSWTELRLVTWPSRTVARKLTFAVLVFAAIFGAIVAGVDFVLDRLFRDILLK